MRTAFFAACLASAAFADEPASSYIFPAGGQRGTTVRCRVGGMNLSSECGFGFLGGGAEVTATLRSVPTQILIGPYHTNPVAQQAWDYPRDMAVEIPLPSAASPGLRTWYCTTSEGATALRPFVIGDLPEVMEDEEKTVQGRPQAVTMPVTINGRIYPRGDLDEFAFAAKAGDRISCEVVSQRLGYKLDARLEILDASGVRIAANDDLQGQDAFVTVALPADGRYVVRIHDIAFEGDQDYVYRLTLRAGPVVTHVFPAGLRRGTTGRVRLYGPDGFVDEEFIVPVDLPVSELLSSTGRPESAPFGLLFQGSDLPEAIEKDSPATQVVLPGALNGQISPVGDVDDFVFSAEKGQKFDFELYGRRLGSPISAVCVVLDDKGKEWTRHESDGRFTFTAMASGDYTLRVQERHRETHGGTEFVYRVIGGPAQPDFRLASDKETVSVLPGQSAKLKLTSTRFADLKGDIVVSAEHLPDGVTMASATMVAGKNQVEISFTAAAHAPVGRTRRVSIVGTAGNIVRRLDALAVTVAPPPQFSIETEEVYGFANRGATYLQKYSITRAAGFDGEVEVRIADRQSRYLQGVTGPTIVVKPGQNEFVYPIFLPEGMDLNRTTRVVLMGTARVNGHFVTHTTKKQIVARVSPSVLTLAPDPDFVELRPGAKVSLRLGRAPEITGPVTIRSLSGAGIDPITVTDGREFVEIPIAGAEAGLIVFRAEARRDGHPVIAEASVRLSQK